jgi:hypothetical protein
MRPVLRSLTPLLLALALLLAACSTNSNPRAAEASPTVQPAGAGLHCQPDDHGLDVPELGWGFCYPSGWHFVEREATTTTPAGVDTTLDVVGSDGLFGFMIIGSYERGSAADLASWLAANAPADADDQSIAWGNAQSAVEVKGQLRRYALTRHRVYLLSLRQGANNLDLDAEMSKRLGTWNFVL